MGQTRKCNIQCNSINHTELNLVEKCESDMSGLPIGQLLSLNPTRHSSLHLSHPSIYISVGCLFHIYAICLYFFPASALRISESDVKTFRVASVLSIPSISRSRFRACIYIYVILYSGINPRRLSILDFTDHVLVAICLYF